LFYKGHVIMDLIDASSAALPHVHNDVIHYLMMALSSICAIAGIAFAFVFYTFKPGYAEKMGRLFKGPIEILQGKYFVDEFYDRVIVKPLFITGQVLYLIDQLVIHATIMSFGWAPRLIGKTVQPTQTGRLHGYGLGMVAGVAAIALLLLFLL
jgi:NADH-quinone oxidoreductase subunit L